MKQNEKDKHRLMDKFLKEDAMGGADEALLKSVQLAITGGERTAEIKTEPSRRYAWPMAWAALLIVSAVAAFLIMRTDWTENPDLTAAAKPEARTPEEQAAALVEEKRRELLEVVKKAGFPYSVSGEPSVSGADLFRAVQLQDDNDPASRCDMILRIEDVVSATDPTPTRISFTYQVGGKAVTEYFTKGDNWISEESGAAPFPFRVELTQIGRQGIALYVGRMAEYLRKSGASLKENDSLLVNANHRENSRVQMPNIPSLSSDLALILRDAKDLTAFPRGFSLLTPYRLYFANDVNLVASGSAPSGDLLYPPLVCLAPEKRFGIREQAINIDFQGQLNYVGRDQTGRPLDLRSGVNDEVVAETIEAPRPPMEPSSQDYASARRQYNEAVAKLTALGGEIAPAPRNELALASVAATNLGKHSDGASWANVSIQGGVFASGASGASADQARTLRQGGTLGGSQPIGGVSPLVRSQAVPRSKAVRPLDLRSGVNAAPEAPAVDRERYGQLVDQPWKSPWKAPLSTFSVDVDTASYTNIRRMLKSGAGIPKDAVRLEECLNYFDYGYAAPVKGGPFAVHVDLASCPWEETHHLVKIGIKGREVPNHKRPPSNLVFLIDVSGSMNEISKLPLLVESMKVLVEELDERDSVGIVVYAGSAGTVLEPTKVAGGGRDAILAALDRLRAGGSTAGAAGIRGAYELAAKQYRKGGVNRVILATDGDFNVGTSGQGELVDLVKENAKSGVSLSVLGFGTGNINDAMMEAITNEGNGNYFYIDSQREGRKVFLQNLTGTLVTIAKDVKLQVEFNPGKVAAYRLIGYANRILRDQDFNNDKVDAGDIGAGHTVTALYEIVPVGVELPNLGGVDALKYQKPAGREVADSPEWMTVKLRYKKPDGDKSTLLEVPVKGAPVDWRTASSDYIFAAAVALFGEKLRGSDKIGDFAWKKVGNLALRGAGQDRHGHRAEFLELLGAAAKLRPDKEFEPVPADAIEAPEAR